MRRWLAPACFLALLTAPSFAFAEGSNCPPGGGWFCEDVAPPAAADDDADLPDEADPTEDAPAQEPKKKVKKKIRVKRSKANAAAAGQRVDVQGQGGSVVIVKDPSQRVVIVNGESTDVPPPPAAPKKKKQRRWRETVGLNLRLEGAGFANAYDSGPVGMGGLGASFRWRPAPAFALDVGTDFLGGEDYYGNSRFESALSASAMVFFNPQHRVQVYAIGGVHGSHAEVDTNSCGNYPTYYCDFTSDVSHNYLGGHLGLGLEWRVARHVGLDFDALGLIRHRVGDGPPEFVDPETGRSTDTSAGMLARAGVTFWW